MVKGTEKRDRAPLALEEIYVSQPDVGVPRNWHPKPNTSSDQKKEEMEDGGRVTSAKTRQKLAAFFASISALNIAFISSYYSLAWTQMANETAFEIKEANIRVLAAISPISSIFGSILSGMVIDMQGPKTTLALSGLPCMLAWGAITFSHGISYIYIGTFITGIFMGMYYVVPQIYICEVAAPNIRGLLAAMPEVFLSIGFLACNAFGPTTNWRYIAIIFGVIPGLPLMSTLLFMPESPRWLIKRNKYVKARSSLRYFRKGRTNVAEELSVIQTTVSETNLDDITSLEQIKLFTEPHNFKPLVLVCLLFVGKSLSGLMFAISSTTSIFAMANTGLTPVVSAVIVGVVRLLSTLISAVLVDPVGRKIMLIISSFGSCMAVVTIGVLLYFRDLSEVQEPSWLPLIFLLIFVFFNQLGFGTLPCVLSGEMIPLAIRPLGTGLALAIYSTILFVANAATDGLHITSAYVVFWIYGALNVSGIILGILIPETKGKSLAEIQRCFNPNVLRE